VFFYTVWEAGGRVSPPDSCSFTSRQLRLVIKRGDNMTKIFRNQKGQGLTEYALIIALVAIVAVAALTLLGGQIDAIFGQITGALGG